MGWFASTHFKLGAILLTSYPAHSAGDALDEERSEKLSQS